MGDWLASNWFDVLSAIGIISSLLFTGVSLRSETKTRRISNLIALTSNHRQLWTQLLENSKLKRVLDASADLEQEPITTDEELFVSCAIQHLNSAHYTISDKLVIKPEGLRVDIAWFFSLPIPCEVWRRSKSLQNVDFVAFVDGCLDSKSSEHR